MADVVFACNPRRTKKGPEGPFSSVLSQSHDGLHHERHKAGDLRDELKHHDQAMHNPPHLLCPNSPFPGPQPLPEA